MLVERRRCWSSALRVLLEMYWPRLSSHVIISDDGPKTAKRSISKKSQTRYWSSAGSGATPGNLWCAAAEMRRGSQNLWVCAFALCNCRNITMLTVFCRPNNAAGLKITRGFPIRSVMIVAQLTDIFQRKVTSFHSNRFLPSLWSLSDTRSLSIWLPFQELSSAVR